MASTNIPVVSADAGDPQALKEPNSPASIMKKAQASESQSAADTKFDAPPPPREGFRSYDRHAESKGIFEALFLASASLLLLYKAAPE